MGILAIDDRDPLLSYSPSSAWNPGGVSSEYNSTTSYSSNTGSTVKLTFTGTNVGVFGTINPNTIDGPPSSSYSIDNGSPVVFTGKQTYSVQYQQRFFSSGTLTPATHTLLITLLSQNSTYFLDYITVALPDPGVTSVSSSSSISSSSSSQTSSSLTRSPATTRSSIVTRPSTSSSITPTSSTLPSDASSTSDVGIIVGGVLGGIALIVLATIATLFIRKSRREKKMDSDFDPQSQSLWTRYTPSNSQLTPFITPRYRRLDDSQFGLVDNPRMTPQTFGQTSAPYDPPSLAPSRSSPTGASSSKASFSRHVASPSQHSLISQVPPTEASSSRATHAVTGAQVPGITPTNDNDLPPPPRYVY